MWLVAALLGLAPFTVFGAELLCPEIEITEKIEPPLSDNELRLICGESTHTDGKFEGWSKIPTGQAVLSLRGFLQSRGLLRPTFVPVKNGIRVTPGPVTRVTAIKTNAEVPGLDMSRKRRVLGEPMTPSLLDSVMAWTRNELSRRGYPCGTVQADGNPETGAVFVRVEKGDRLFVQSIETRFQEEAGFDPSSLRRFDAFKFGAPYDSSLLAISADRTITDGLAERTYFIPVCPGNGIVQQESILGEKRILSAGFGLNTEEVSSASLSLKRVRLGTNSSSASAEARVSFKEQQITTYYDWRFLSPSARQSIRPILELKHRNENPFEFYSERILAGYSKTFDFSGMGLGLLLGPEFRLYQTKRGFSASRHHALGFDLELRMISHEHEFNRTKLGGGFRAALEARSNVNDFASNFGSTIARLRVENIWNFSNFEPPVLLLVLRGGYSVTFPQNGAGALQELPPDDQNFLGGIADIRGFSRMELPNPDGLSPGGLSAGYLGLELRPDILGGEVEPMFFVDVGALGLRSYFFDDPVYWSPGVGLNWNSPLGALRTTLAHGYTTREVPGAARRVSHWQFYLSLGEPL
ncbi:MAG TPA: BamA/TamA family outer membrane protein [Bdellovibrionota bacterium]|nr:BamA/TamA family outer membrane protein [Bdellovibrionota bacterium]